jgi:hypothetical protein
VTQVSGDESVEPDSTSSSPADPLEVVDYEFNGPADEDDVESDPADSTTPGKLKYFFF